MPLGYYSQANVSTSTTFVISAGAAGEIGYSESPFWAADDCLVINCGRKLNPKYVYYYLSNNQQRIKSKVRKASVPRLSKEVIQNFEIAVPSIEHQRQIVNDLDSICLLMETLRKELILRNTQYEYYREQLLAF